MNKIQQQHYLNKVLLADKELDFFFELVLKRLGGELERLRETIFYYEDVFGNEREPTVYEEIFGLNEQAWVGVLNNAIIRAFSDTVNTLQEFTVYNNEQSVESDIRSFNGRADLLVQWKNFKGEEVYLLFEAKQNRESNLSKLHADPSGFIDEIVEQGNRYIEADEVYFKKKIVFVVPIVFGWIRGCDFIKSAKEYFNKINKKEDFCSLYYEGDIGVWVYGSVYNSKGEKLK